MIKNVTFITLPMRKLPDTFIRKLLKSHVIEKHPGMLDIQDKML